MKIKKFDSAILFLIPSFLGFGLFYIVPFIISFQYSLFDKTINGKFVGLQNYISLFSNNAYQKALTNTIIFIGICVPLSIILSLLMAILIRNVKSYKKFFVLIFLIPLVIPSGSITFFWKSFFSDNGYLNYLLSLINIEKINWLESNIVRYVIIFIFIWKNVGYNVVLFLAGFSSIPKEYYENAKVEGATAFEEFFYITIVYLKPTTILIVIMSIINSFKVFREIYLLTGSYPHDTIYMLQHYMNNMFTALNYQKLSSATWVLIIIITVFTQVVFRKSNEV